MLHRRAYYSRLVFPRWAPFGCSPAVTAGPNQAARPRSATTRSSARSSTRRPTWRSTNGYFKDAGLDIELDDRRTAATRSMAALISGSADIALDGTGDRDLRAQQRFADQGAHLLRPDRDRRLHAGRPHQARQIRLEHAQGQGRPRLPARAARRCCFFEAAMRMNGVDPDTDVKLVQQYRRPGACRRLARRPEPIRDLHRAGCVAARARRQRLISSPRSATPSALPTTRPSWRPTNIIADNPAIVQSWTDAIYHAQKWTAAASAAEIAKVVAPFFPGVNPQALTDAADALPEAENLEDHRR